MRNAERTETLLSRRINVNETDICSELRRQHIRIAELTDGLFVCLETAFIESLVIV